MSDDDRDEDRLGTSAWPADKSIDLAMRAKAGDDYALEQLLTRYLPRLRRWASPRMPAHRTMNETGDLVQDALINAIRHLPRIEIRHEGALYAYFRQAVQNRLIDYYRSRQRRPERLEMPDDAQAEQPSPMELAMSAEAIKRYEAALERLSPHDRQLVILRVECGEEYSAIAAAMEKPSTAAARMACGRAVARLAQEMRRVG